MQKATFSGRYENLEKISELVVQAASAAGFDDSTVYQVQLAVDEACTNIIEHAYGGENQGSIRLEIEETPAELTFRLFDLGKPFDPALVREPNLKLPLEEIEPRGVGLYLMRKMMDEVRFEFSPEKGNKLVMVKRKPAG